MTSEQEIIQPLNASVVDFFEVLARWRKFLVWLILVSTISTGFITFLMPKWYKATASVFPAEQTSLFPGLESVSSLFKNLSPVKKLGGLSGNSETDRYVAILKSQSLSAAMIQHFDLIRVYGWDGASYANERTVKDLFDNTAIEVQDEGNLTISVFDKDPKRAADMANYYVSLLNTTNSSLLVQNARGNREFIEQRYEKNRQDLVTAEEAMKQFQVKYGVLAVPEQTEVSIKAGAEISAKLASKEIEYQVLRRTMSVDHPSVVAVQAEIEEMKRKLNSMNAATGDEVGSINFLIPFREAPKLAQEYIRLYRELEIQNKILEFITPIYEQAKIEEKRNTPSVVILDHAIVPERKAKPKIMLYMLLAFVVSALVGLSSIFIAEAFVRMRSRFPDRVHAIIDAIQSDWGGLKISKPNRNRLK